MDILKARKVVGLMAPIMTVLVVLAAIILKSEESLQSAISGLELCARVIIPSLLPFFILSSMLSQLGLPRYLGRLLSPLMSRLFGVSGPGAAAFVLGLSGGYPLGAATVLELYNSKECGKEEAERLLAFCNNSGPAFIVGVAGVGVFRSSVTGMLLFFVHITAAVLVGMLFSGRREERAGKVSMQHFRAVSLSKALSSAVKSSVSATLTICGFVVFFSGLVGVLEALGAVGSLSEALKTLTGIDPRWFSSLITGILELGSGIGSMSGLPATPLNIALAAFILGWGGLSVHCQVTALMGDSQLSMRLHFAGRLLHGIISALLVLGISIFV